MWPLAAVKRIDQVFKLVFLQRQGAYKVSCENIGMTFGCQIDGNEIKG